MINLNAGNLTIEVDERVPGVMSLNWLGRSNDRNPGSVLHPYFDHLFSYAREKSLGIEMHFEKLEHFNSSTIAVLIQLINSAQDRGLRLSVRYDSKLKWQALSFDALKRALRPFEEAGVSSPPILFQPI